MSKMSLTGVILAGGKSSRMGRDKALLPFGGKTMLETMAWLSQQIFEATLILVNDRLKTKGLELYGATVCEDFFRNKGPLAGIYTGLCRSKTQASCVLTCDMPFMDEGFLRNLAALWRPDIDALSCEDPRGKLQPFPGIYNRSSRDLIRILLDQGEHSMRRFFEVALVQPVILSAEKIEVFTNMNTIEDYYYVLKEKGERVQE